MSSNDFLKEIASNITNFQDIPNLLGIEKIEFNDPLTCIQSIAWSFIKPILDYSNKNVIDHIEKLFPHVAQNDIKFSNLQLQTVMKNNYEFDLVSEITKRVYDWRGFARTVGLSESEIGQIKEDFSRIGEQTSEVMRRFCHPLPINNTWSFWKDHLLEFQCGRDVVFEMELTFAELIKECEDSINHCCIHNGYVRYFHQHVVSVEQDVLLPLDENRDIAVNIGGAGVALFNYQYCKQFNEQKQEYFDSYSIFMDLKTFDFTLNKTKSCDILQTIQLFLNETGDNGFAFKGYSLRNHYAMFGQNLIVKEEMSKHILSYFSNDNILLHIKICDNKNEMSREINNFSQEVQIARSVHECIRDNPVVHIGVIVIGDSFPHDKNLYPCNQCVEKHLMIPKSTFSNKNSFKEWYGKVVKQNKTLIQLKNQVSQSVEISSNNISKELKKNIIAQMAIGLHIILPTFTPLPEYQIQELGKLVLLNPCQMEILYSHHKHIIIRGGYGSGKSLVLQQRFEKVLKESDDKDLFYFLCHDQMSQFAEQMKLIKEKYPEKFIEVYNIRELKEIEDESVKLSDVLTFLKESLNKNQVHIFINEFNGTLITEAEIKLIKNELALFTDSHIVIAVQTTDYEEVIECKCDTKSQFKILGRETGFQICQLDYSLQCSLEICKFINSSIDILNAQLIFARLSSLPHLFKEDFDFSGCNLHSSDSEDSILNRYTFKRPKFIGHHISCGKVKIYKTTNNTQCTISDSASVQHQVCLILSHLLERAESYYIERYVICTIDGDVLQSLQKMLQNSKVRWTTEVSAYIRKDDPFTLLVTDYNSIRGFQFENVIFVLQLDKAYSLTEYRLIECLSTATTNLHIILHVLHNKNSKLLECWKTHDCVEWKELLFDNARDCFLFELNNGDSEEILSVGDISEVVIKN